MKFTRDAATIWMLDHLEEFRVVGWSEYVELRLRDGDIDHIKLAEGCCAAFGIDIDELGDPTSLDRHWVWNIADELTCRDAGNKSSSKAFS